MIRFASLSVFAVLLCTCACDASPPIQGSPSSQERLIIYAAASLSEAFGEIAHTFNTLHPGVDLAFNLAGSNTLRAQIEQGAMADVFASANSKEMDELVAHGFVGQNEPLIFLTNKLVVITPAGNPARISALADLVRSGTKLVVATEDVPVGRYSRLMLDNVGAEFKALVLANAVSNETTVKQVVAKILLGEADAGIVYSSDVLAAPDLNVIEIPVEFNVLAEYPIAPLADSPNPELARQFVAFVLSPDGQDILYKWGFTPLSAPVHTSPP